MPHRGIEQVLCQRLTDTGSRCIIQLLMLRRHAGCSVLRCGHAAGKLTLGSSPFVHRQHPFSGGAVLGLPNLYWRSQLRHAAVIDGHPNEASRPEGNELSNIRGCARRSRLAAVLLLWGLSFALHAHAEVDDKTGLPAGSELNEDAIESPREVFHSQAIRGRRSYLSNLGNLAFNSPNILGDAAPQGTPAPVGTCHVNGASNPKALHSRPVDAPRQFRYHQCRRFSIRRQTMAFWIP